MTGEGGNSNADKRGRGKGKRNAPVKPGATTTNMWRRTSSAAMGAAPGLAILAVELSRREPRADPVDPCSVLQYPWRGVRVRENLQRQRSSRTLMCRGGQKEGGKKDTSERPRGSNTII